MLSSCSLIVPLLRCLACICSQFKKSKSATRDYRNNRIEKSCLCNGALRGALGPSGSIPSLVGSIPSLLGRLGMAGRAALMFRKLERWIPTSVLRLHVLSTVRVAPKAFRTGKKVRDKGGLLFHDLDKTRLTIEVGSAAGSRKWLGCSALLERGRATTWHFEWWSCVALSGCRVVAFIHYVEPTGLFTRTVAGTVLMAGNKLWGKLVHGGITRQSRKDSFLLCSDHPSASLRRLGSTFHARPFGTFS